MKVLVLRGGAIGDFLLTLPAMGVLKAGIPGCELDVMGYRRVLPLVEGRYYAKRTRSIDYGPLAKFFDPRAEPDPGLADYFCGFDQIVSYIFDPDGLFAGNLARAGAKNILAANPIIAPTGGHAALQLAAPLSAMGLRADSPEAKIHLTEEDQNRSSRLASRLQEPFLTVHPGSGSPQKNWNPALWGALVRALLAGGTIRSVAFVCGESDEAPRKALEGEMAGLPAAFFEGLELIEVAALAARSRLFMGHDSGISHLAAAAGARCLLVFGPTDPAIWAPANAGVRVIRPEGGDLSRLGVEEVLRGAAEMLGEGGDA